MKRGQLTIIVVVVLAVLLLGGSGVVDQVVDAVTSGARVGPKTTIGVDGLVADEPHGLAAAAGLDDETYALARALSSEYGQQGDAYLYAAGWAIRNYAAERGLSIFMLVTNPQGEYGAQNARSGAKYCSTAHDPLERHAAAAAAILSGAAADPTGGATHFFAPRTQDALANRAQGYTKTADQVIAQWTAPGGLYPEGAVAVVPDGVDGDLLTLFRRNV